MPPKRPAASHVVNNNNNNNHPTPPPTGSRKKPRGKSYKPTNNRRGTKRSVHNSLNSNSEKPASKRPALNHFRKPVSHSSNSSNSSNGSSSYKSSTSYVLANSNASTSNERWVKRENSNAFYEALRKLGIRNDK